jgi:ABC-type multidrug transport system permease subunit
MHWGGAIFSGVVWLLIFGLISMAWGDSSAKKSGGAGRS